MASNTMYNNYQLSSPAQYSSGKSQQIDLLDDSIYSTTPFGGGSVLSPSVTARESMTPRKQNVHFDFPPELCTASSSESSTSGDELAFAQPTKLVAAPTPRSSESFTSMVSYNNNSNLIRVPRSNNPHGADAVHPKKKTMKKQRKRRTAAGAVAGMAVGGLVLGPVGVFVGGAAGGVAANKIHKCRERRAQRKYEQKSFQQAATCSKTAQIGTFA
jgi:hypothetical protein